MKKQAILIQCHNKPEQINRLISVMPADKFDFYIHIDKKSDIMCKIIHKNNVFFSERIDVRWGRFSQVEATLALFKMVDASEYSYIHLISGNDFIIKPIEYIESFFSNNSAEYIESIELPEKLFVWGAMDRVEVWYPQFIIDRPSNTVFRALRVIYREFVMRTKILKRKNMPVTAFYLGSSWFSLTGGCVEWIKEYLKNNPDYTEFFRHGVCVDEVFFQTLVHISPYAKNVANRNMTYMVWGGSKTGGPNEMKINNLDKMLASDCIFARKFTDMSTINTVCERLDIKENITKSS